MLVVIHGLEEAGWERDVKSKDGKEARPRARQAKGKLKSNDKGWRGGGGDKVKE